MSSGSYLESTLGLGLHICKVGTIPTATASSGCVRVEGFASAEPRQAVCPVLVPRWSRTVPFGAGSVCGSNTRDSGTSRTRTPRLVLLLLGGRCSTLLSPGFLI